MVIGGTTRRPGLVLAVCAWAAFAARAVVGMQKAVTIDAPLHARIYVASTGFAGIPGVCLFAAAVLVLMERMSSPADAVAAQAVGWTLVASAVWALLVNRGGDLRPADVVVADAGLGAVHGGRNVCERGGPGGRRWLGCERGGPPAGLT